MATIVHFNISANAPQQLRDFYARLFDWKIKEVPGMDFYFIETTDLDGKKGLGGGMSKETAGSGRGMTNFIGVRSIDETVDSLLNLGGKIVVPKQPIPGFGYNAVCSDPENNIFGLFQEGPTEA